MNYKTVLEKLEAIRALAQRVMKVTSGDDRQADLDQIAMLYGEVEEVFLRLVDRSEVMVPQFHGAKPSIYPNFFEAGFLSGSSTHSYEGYKQLLKVIGKIRQLAENPGVISLPPSITGLYQTLRRFRECCQYIQHPPTSEREVQDILWVMLRSQYERLDREDTLPRFGIKAYKPDFGIPDLQTLVEVKFIGDKTEPPAIQEEILADIPGYLSDSSRFTGIVELIYDHAQKLRDPRKFIEDLKKVEGILEVIVIPGIGR